MKWTKAGILVVLAGFGFRGETSLQAAGLPVSLDFSAQGLQGGALGPMEMTAAPLPAQVAYGKNVAIPIEITNIRGPVKGITAEIVFDLLDASGSPVSAHAKPAVVAAGPISAPTYVTVSLEKDPKRAQALRGTAIIDRADLAPMRRGGSLRYYFHLRRGTQDSFFMKGAGAPASTVSATPAPDASAFQTQFMDTFSYPVTTAGANAVVPDPQQTDGKTAVVLGPNAVSGPGTLTIHQDDIDQVPSYMGFKPVAAYTFTLDGTSLQRTARVTLSYPADISGNVLSDLGLYKSGDLALYSYVAPYGWQLVTRPDTDPTLHTVSGVTTHFSSFALFPVGTIGASDIRPRERIITPNGDGVNDTATFTGLTDQEEVHLFDVRGRRVRTITGPPHIWDGKDDGGRVVESGVYLYQYTSLGQRVSGVIVVAK